MKKPRRICSYLSPDGSRPAEEFIRRLDGKLQRKIGSQLRMLANPAYSFAPPHVKAFRLDAYKGLYELRTREKQMIRIIFCICPDGTVILLHGFIKKEERATEKALKTARARMLALASGAAGYEDVDLE